MSRNIFSFSTILSWSAAILSVVLLAGCVDDDLGIRPGVYPEGEATVSLEAAFPSFAGIELQSRATDAPPGDGMKDMSDLVVLAYDTDGRLMDISADGNPVKIEFSQDEVVDETRDDSDAGNGHKAEDVTKCLKKTLTLPYGEYYLVAVANLGTYGSDMMPADGHDTYYELTEGKFKGQYSTLSALRLMKVSWDTDDYRQNRAMLGFFTNRPDDGKETDAPNDNSEFKTVVVDGPGVSLRAWLRRCASKVTIDFDGSGLRENVHVYIKDARIYDIPKYCTLGFGRKTTPAGSEDYNNHPVAAADLYTTSGHHIDYGEGTDFHNWPVITKGSPYICEGTDAAGNPKRKDFHGATDNALFFYENMQGDAPGGKLPVADLVNGGVQGSEEIKDGVPYGTYIEVTAHYYSNADGNIAQGTIKYRFMLGKDVEKSCDAERNYHYKLTLKLRGNANDYDWHIDYSDDTGFDIPNPWYVSYLYNHDAMLPFKYTPAKGHKLLRLEAVITENPWYPTEIPSDDYAAPFNETANREPGNGFLSLRVTEKTVITWNDAHIDEFEYTDDYIDANNDYYYGRTPSSAGIDRSRRTYYFDGTPDDTNVPGSRDAYSYQKDGDKITFKIPLFTRAKVMIKESGYSGNNPYVGYERHAKLKIIAYLEDENGKEYTDEGETTVIQVRRLVNPKGVYRDFGNNEDFDVNMLRLPGDDAKEFIEFDSDGPWMAEIVGDKNFITLNGRQHVSGSTKTPVKFTIKFNKLNNDRVVRNAVVRVKYHNYTCTHLIFVRQGYTAQAISPNGRNLDGDMVPATKWSTFNWVSAKNPAKDPRDEGAMFRYSNVWGGIDAYSNVYRDAAGNVDCGFPADSQFATPPPIYIVNGDGSHQASATAWNDIWSNGDGFNAQYPIATARDFEQLYLTDHIEFGYGVLYADGATSTQTSVNKAYGWYRGENDNTKGMRGMFAYFWNPDDPDNEYTARNVFFPIGRSGYGHRKGYRNNTSAPNIEEAGTLRYSCNRSTYTDLFLKTAPLFSSLYRRSGAIYYAKTPVRVYKIWNNTIYDTDEENADKAQITKDGGRMLGLDINYFTFDVNAITASNLMGADDTGYDACFVRTVE